MGDIGMIKGVLLAWLLCRRKGIFNGVVDPRINSGLGVYRREEGEETINKSTQLQSICMTSLYDIQG